MKYAHEYHQDFFPRSLVNVVVSVIKIKERVCVFNLNI